MTKRVYAVLAEYNRDEPGIISIHATKKGATKAARDHAAEMEQYGNVVGGHVRKGDESREWDVWITIKLHELLP